MRWRLAAFLATATLVLLVSDLAAQDARREPAPVLFQLDGNAPQNVAAKPQVLTVIRDAKYVPKLIGEILTDIAPPTKFRDPPPAVFDDALPIKLGKDGKPILIPGSRADKTFSTSIAMRLNRPDGAWVVQSFSGPVAPFEHLPLYFEDASLERCGQTHGCLGQSLLSAVHFYGTIPLLPYKMTDRHPWRHICPSWECPPCSLSEKLESVGRRFRGRPAASQAAAIAALFLAFP